MSPSRLLPLHRLPRGHVLAVSRHLRAVVAVAWT